MCLASAAADELLPHAACPVAETSSTVGPRFCHLLCTCDRLEPQWHAVSHVPVHLLGSAGASLLAICSAAVLSGSEVCCLLLSTWSMLHIR